MFIHSSTWDPKLGQETGLDLDLGPSLGRCITKPPKQRKEPEYQPVSDGKRIGRVSSYNVEKGYGRIDRFTFFHISDVTDGNSSRIKHGVMVAYREGVDQRNGRDKAVDIQLINQTGGNKND